jgi:drug/metabolite transporter (DMT)-like permease
MVMIMARIFLHEPISKKSLSAIVMSVTGICILILGQSNIADLHTSIIGDILILGASLSAAFYMVCARSLGSQLSSLVITSYQMFYGTLLFLPVFIYKYPSLNWHNVTPKSFAALIFLALFCSVAGYFLYNYALTQIPASQAAVFLNGVPLVTAVTASVVLGECLTPLQMTGGLIIITAVFIANLPLNGHSRVNTGSYSEKG